MNRKSLLMLGFVVVVASLVSACSSSKKTPVISVTLAPAPPASLEVSLSVQVAADTPGDSTNAGVNWTISCTSADCGSITPAQTAPGAPAVYLAPKTVPTGGSVTITATSVTNSSASASGTTTINPLGSNAGMVAGGQYAFVATGEDSAGFYAIDGSFTSDGMGNVTGGEEDFSDVNFTTNDTVTGTYNIGSDGRGTLTLNPMFNGAPDTNLGVAGVQTFSITASSNFVTAGTHLMITEVDGSATSTGTIDLQNSGDFASGVVPNTYVFNMIGWDLSDDGQTSFGGVLTTADGATIASGILDIDDTGGTGSANPASGTITTLDANGRGVISVPGFNSDTYTYVVYQVGAEAFKVIETDDFFVEGGSMFGALAAPANGYDTTGLSGSFAFGDNGQGPGGPVAFAGQVTTDGAGNLTAGFSDANEFGNVTNGAVTGTYAVPDPTMPRAIVTITGGNSGDLSNFIVYYADPTLNFLDPNNGNAASGALLMDSDDDANGAGFVTVQAPPAENPIVGNYAVGLQIDAETDLESDLVGQGFVDTSENFTGNVDVGFDGSGAATDQPAVIQFTADSNNPGRATGSGTIGGVDGGGTLSFVIYQVSGAQGFIIENDTFEVAYGTTVSQ